MRGALWRGTFASFIILFIFGAITLVIFKGADLMQQGELASEHFFTFLLMTGLVAGSIGGMAAQFSALQRGLGAIESVMDIVEQEREVEDLNASTPDLSLRKTVTLTDVHFNYPQRPDVHVLKGLNLRIDAGDQVALVGTSGAGKSTVASLLLRFHEPDTGVLRVGDIPASDLDLRGYRQRVAFVPQEVILFGGDLRSNIRYGRPDATEEEVIDAAKRAFAWNFIKTSPRDWTPSSASAGFSCPAANASGCHCAGHLEGSRPAHFGRSDQRLGQHVRARGSGGPRRLMKGRSSVVIAHRLSTVKNASRICVMEDGRVVEEGKHDELMGQGGPYAQLVKNQELAG